MKGFIHYQACIDKPTSEDPVTIWDVDGRVHTAQYINGKWYLPDEMKEIKSTDVIWWGHIYNPRGFKLDEKFYFEGARR